MLVPLLLGGVIVAYAMTRKTKKRTREEEDSLEFVEWTDEEAIDQAIAEGGSLAEMTSTAYFLAYPDCPELLEPDNPDHEACVELWLEMRDMVAERTGLDAEEEGGYVEPEEEQEEEQEAPDYGECDPLDPSGWAEGMLCEVDEHGLGRYVPEEEEGECTIGVDWSIGAICIDGEWQGFNYWLPDNVLLHYYPLYGGGDWYGEAEFDATREPGLFVRAYLAEQSDVSRSSTLAVALAAMLAERNPDLPMLVTVRPSHTGPRERHTERLEVGIYPGRHAPGYHGEPDFVFRSYEHFSSIPIADLASNATQAVARLRYEEGI